MGSSFRLAVFGGYDIPEDFADSPESRQLLELGRALSAGRVTALVGNAKGHLHPFVEGMVEEGEGRDGRVIAVRSVEGIPAWGRIAETRGRFRAVYGQGEYTAKKDAFFGPTSRVDGYLALPSDHLGTMVEFLEAIDRYASYDRGMDRSPLPVLLWQDAWGAFYREHVLPRLPSKQDPYVHSVFSGREVLDHLRAYSEKRV